MRRLSLFISILSLLLTYSAHADEQALIKQMRDGGTVLMIRHALAPGIGDPEDFQLDDCSTQRNLDDEGRDQARDIGKWLHTNKITNVKIYSSQWCRCLETAELMNIGKVTPLPALNSFFESPADREPNLAAVRKFIKENSKPGELMIMVTHQVTIAGITDKWTDSGEGKLVRANPNGAIELLGEVRFH
jgi:phosphohistidine phosphatase SixA